MLGLSGLWLRLFSESLLDTCLRSVSICLFPSLYLSIFLPTSLYTLFSISLCLSLSFCLSVTVSLYLSISLYLSLSLCLFFLSYGLGYGLGLSLRLILSRSYLLFILDPTRMNIISN